MNRPVNTVEPKRAQIEFIHKDINESSNGIVLSEPVFQAFRKQRTLPPIHSLNEASHPILRKSRCKRRIIMRQSDQASRFYTARVKSDRVRCNSKSGSHSRRIAAKRPTPMSPAQTTPQRSPASVPQARSGLRCRVVVVPITGFVDTSRPHSAEHHRSPHSTKSRDAGRRSRPEANIIDAVADY